MEIHKLLSTRMIWGVRKTATAMSIKTVIEVRRTMMAKMTKTVARTKAAVQNNE